MIHRLKTLQPYFDDVKSGKKPFEIRVNVRDYQAGDILVLEEYNNTDLSTGYTGQVIIKSVTYVLTNCSQYGLKDGYCIMGLAENSWIPVSERLPEESRANYEVTFINECEWEEHGFSQWYNEQFHIPAKVIAWREHLEPYKPE